MKKVCQNCGKPFIATNGKQIYCNNKCRRQYYHRKKNPLEERICKFCGKQFIPKHNNELTCSKSCGSNLNRIKSRIRMRQYYKENRELMRANNKAYWQRQAKEYSKIIGEKISTARYGYMVYGWGVNVKERDKYTCQKCGYKGKDVIAHHILPKAQYPELTFDMNNGITLCPQCHNLGIEGSVHNVLGVKYTMNDFKSWLNGGIVCETES